ncbi:MAG: molybdopterin-dependent oxidoreductase [Armatimonadetes bacterium]|nr:molybdopterin-dependent oxidoreductase [Armatimonadota bacterium]
MSDRERRLPPGQRPVPRQRDVAIGPKPPFDPAAWDLQVVGLVRQPQQWTWQQFAGMPRVSVQADLHCVEGWSVLDLVWEGPLLRDLLAAAQPLDEARYLFVSCADGYTTSLPLDVASRDDVILAWLCNGEPLPDYEGGPVQLIVPGVYAYKWARWVRQFELMAEDRLGYWEERGYSNTADVWKNDRRAR